MNAAGLNIADLESVYDALAQAIDQVPADRSPLFLTKLALILAREVGDRERVTRAIETALADL